ncbi:peptide ABC transporter ATP-binding protein [Hymenobacter qilianensis]|uniref:Peptide ABC transporter ATP-binding protein n=2 Tax=Hymenobacter qilianensis TaxID=1385715 RepID=A0ACB5PNU7_9BACT|nr:ABC transporter ATP-binding protein [Hymenobacter qilianensis]QNP53363.1 ABC transporter ATP-binding protein [Hymenobacter qilianensis]GGF57221.1 peptide ABC transporter ATP-binding protein [Hymenobacter qilianensis]
MQPLLTVSNLTIDFTSHRGDVRAVNDVSFELRRGETLAIVGESGSGKSVTSLALMGLIQMPPGRVTTGQTRFQSEELGEVDLLKLSDEQLRRVRGNEISMIFQEPMTSLNPVHTCGAQVVEALRLHTSLSSKEAEARTIELFATAQLPRPEKIFKAYPHEISGGQKQRVMIAMAMACNPAILIADEPTTALDVTVQARMLQLIDDLRRQNNTAVLFITHDLGVVAEIADRILVMYRGKVVEQGLVLDIFTNPQHPYTKGLLACRPKLSVGKQRLPVVADFMTEDASGQLTEISASQPEAPSVELDRAPVLTENMPVEIPKMFHGEHFTPVSGLKSTSESAISEPTPGVHLTAGNGSKPAEKTGPVLLRVEGLNVHFPIRKGLFNRTKEYVRAVDGVSFDIYPGETVGLVGESGCGKTTLGRALLRLVEPTAGRILFEGTDLATLPAGELRRRRREFQMVFQDPYAALNPMMTVGEAIIEPMQVHGVGGTKQQQKAKVMELLRTVGLREEHYLRYPHEFSGGQRQRICIARALALQPKCIICDESVSALDVSVQAQVLNLLNQLKRDFGITYLFITHDLSVARFMSDRLLVMNKGQIVESGPAAAVYAKPQHEYTRTLLSAIPKDEPSDIRAAQARRATEVA